MLLIWVDVFAESRRSGGLIECGTGRAGRRRGLEVVEKWWVFHGEAKGEGTNRGLNGSGKFRLRYLHNL